MYATSPTLNRWMRIVLLCGAMGFAYPTMAWAQEPTADAEKDKRYNALTQSAAKKFEKKDYAGAIQDFKQAYSVKPVANVLYNIGRLYEKMGNFEDAVKHYEQFANLPDIDITARKDALERIKTLKEVLALRKKEEDKKNQPDPKEKKDPEKKEDKKVVVKPKEPAEPNYTTSYVLIGTGVAALIGGGVFGALTSSAHDDFTNATTLDDRRDAASTGQTFGYVSDGLFVAGGLLTVIGIITYIATGPEEAKEPAKAAIAPSVGPDRFTVDVSFRF